MYAERLMPHLERAREVQNMETTRDMDPSQRARLGKAKMQVASLIPALRDVLFPEDSDG